MPLTVETGALVADAVSYVTVAEARAYAAARGVTLPEPDSAVELLLVNAMDFIEAFRSRFQGTKVDTDQALQFPRAGLFVDGFEIPETTIPKVLKKAQCQLALDATTMTLQPNSDGREVIREKVDVVEVQYAPSGGAPSPVFTRALALLAPLFTQGSGNGTLKVVRT